MAYSQKLKTIIDLIGPQAAIRIAREYNGRDFAVPLRENLTDMNPIVVLIGLGNARALSDHFGGRLLRMPMEMNTLLQIRNEAVVKQFLASISISSISQEFQIDRKLVQKIIDAAGHKELRIGRSMTS